MRFESSLDDELSIEEFLMLKSACQFVRIGQAKVKLKNKIKILKWLAPARDGWAPINLQGSPDAA